MLDTGAGACYKLHKLRKRKTLLKPEEVNKMMEFLMTMATIATVFVSATVLVVLIAGGLLRLKRGIFTREAKEAIQE